MKERPMLFSAPMARAILDGSKTQTRRVVKHPIPSEVKAVEPYHSRLSNERFGWVLGYSEKYGRIMELSGMQCPYGERGDRLWVRETFGEVESRDGVKSLVYRADGWNDPSGHFKWRPSIHMRRAESRITLEIVSVRVERLNEISEADSLAEGTSYLKLPSNALDTMKARTWFRGLWESINGAGSWQKNPWVWVVEFKRVHP